jgi:quercetin dioxygenase-like cupin family protein
MEAHMATATSNSIQVGPITVDFLVEADDSNGSVTVFECTVPAGSKVPAPHSHDGFEETVYGLEGARIFVLDG